MKTVRWRRHYDKREHTDDLSDLLRPVGDQNSEGAIEAARDQAYANAAAIGRMLAALENAGVIDIAQAMEIADVHVEVLEVLP